MYECDICYNSFLTINLLTCCKGKNMCVDCKSKYGQSKCPFCRKNMKIKNKSTIIIINKNTPYPEKYDIIMSIMNYNIIKIW